ncbi:MAG: dihydrofolate reductase [Bacteroidaceae bacterium]|nr:dihydrofolate reductase [Bacteroidaceae bacterium]
MKEQFADIEMLRYRLKGFEKLSLSQKLYIYYLSKAALAGRDITFNQHCKVNLAVRRLLENVWLSYKGDRDSEDFKAFEVYLKRVWFSNGIHHHYGMEKFDPGFSREWLETVIPSLPSKPSAELLDVIFNPDILRKRVSKEDGVDLIKASACGFYENVTQQEVEGYYGEMSRVYTQHRNGDKCEKPSFGLNSTLVKSPTGEIKEEVWCIDNGGRYARELSQVCDYLNLAKEYAENDKQKRLIEILIDYYHTGSLEAFDEYCKLWVTEREGETDFINGFIEVYGDPLGYKGTWEALVEYVDHEATMKTRLIADNAQWFEDNSPVDRRFKKPVVKGVSARVICAAMLGGDEYPATAIGINLPNADWIREQYGSKSISISNVIAAYNEAAKGSPMKREFTCDEDMISLIDRYADDCDSLHTDLHECLGHGSGQLMPGVATDALKNYFSTIEEARADLFGLYYCADEKMVELGLLPDMEAHKSMYYTYILNGLMTQLVRIKLGDDIEEDHMRNRALIARWAADLGGNAVIEKYRSESKTFVRINDFGRLRQIFAFQLAEIQRIKSEGDYDAAKELIEKYAVKIDKDLHQEILERYRKLNIAPYKGFINPRLSLVMDENGAVADVAVDYTESYTDQMLRYGRGDY